MEPEMKRSRVSVSAVRWTALTPRQQQALTGELARLLCQYVQGEAQRAALTVSREVDDDEPSQDQ